ncbi:hypothetical protein ACH5RR_012815 [Cinchona calisaya]|uniref:Uncharacterized protein n=1 Tax=Cinchona calisaya TaxID=153742 RepID=A0ABD3A8X4_9GENT
MAHVLLVHLRTLRNAEYLENTYLDRFVGGAVDPLILFISSSQVAVQAQIDGRLEDSGAFKYKDLQLQYA